MIKITKGTIDSILDSLHLEGMLDDHEILLREKRKEIKKEKPFLGQYIDFISNSVRNEGGESGSDSYKIGAYITFSMIEEQYTNNKQTSPDIIEDDISRITDHMQIIEDSCTNEKQKMNKYFDMYFKENPIFGEFIDYYLCSFLKNDMINEGNLFLLGASTTYMCYREAFARLENEKVKNH
jgi:hypothetical protein